MKNQFLLPLLCCLCTIGLQAQNNINLRIEAGAVLLSDSENLGLLVNLEPRVMISKNEAIGLRFGLGLNTQKITLDDKSQFFIDEEVDYGVISFVPTYDYYLNERPIRPYVGVGVGYYLLSDIDVDPRGTEDVLEVRVKNQLGALLRGGVVSGKTRIGLEYNFIPKADIELPNGERIGTVNESYLGVSFGFTLCGGNG